MIKEKLRTFWYSLSAAQRFYIRKLYYFPSDFYDLLTNNRHEFVPPKGAIYTGSPSNAKAYLKQSEHQLELLQEHINIQPQDTVLDIGSGVGRTALALTKYLNQNGSYDGFDVVEEGVNWCTKTIHKKHPNFNFKYIPLYNDLYNASGQEAKNFVFPYATGHFDKIFTFSVFTHMMVDEIDNYCKEMSRVLKKDGLAFSTFFIYDDTNETQIAKQNPFNFPHAFDGYRLMNTKVKSGNIALHIHTLQAILAKNNLVLVSITEGTWKTWVHTSKEYQDIVVFKNK